MEATKPATDPSSTFFGRHEFLIRRLHSLSGLIPVGAFMCVHLLTNSSVLDGPGTFQDNVDKIHSLGALLPIVEWVFIFLPILFHGIIGVVIIRSGQSNTSNYPLRNNLRYTLQRVTGMIAFVYILGHVLHMHWLGSPLQAYGMAQFLPEQATSSAAAALQASVVVQILYAIGVLACVYHLANGLWTMGITWGVWVTPQAQRRADYLCAAFGIGLAIVGLGALAGFGTVDLTEAQAIEKIRQDEHEQQQQRIERERKALQPATAALP